MLELREELKHIVEIQIVAFPQEGMYTYKGGYDLVEEALKMGTDVVGGGGIPYYELDDPHSHFVELLNALVLMEDYGRRTTASHTCSFGSADNSYSRKSH